MVSPELLLSHQSVIGRALIEVREQVSTGNDPVRKVLVDQR
jgi:hypothetical protein